MKKGIKLEYRMENEISTILIHGEVTNDDAVALRKDIVHWVIDHRPKGVVLFFDSSNISSLGIGAIIAIYQDLLDENIQLVTCLPDEMIEIFLRAKINRILSIFTDKAESINYIKGKIGQ